MTNHELLKEKFKRLDILIKLNRVKTREQMAAEAWENARLHGLNKNKKSLKKAN